MNGDKGGVLFRCDNTDGNCVLEGYLMDDLQAGHWRGENATGETVICPLSYTARWPLAGLCMYGYEVSSREYTSYFASDIHHRLFHMPAIGEYTVDHYAEGYRAALELAVNHPEDAVRNTESLTFFALESMLTILLYRVKGVQDLLLMHRSRKRKKQQRQRLLPLLQKLSRSRLLLLRLR
ncbi:Prenylated Rab acceptor protein 1 [Vermiconidia calcicola]|uniref:Prenylated Rab acceptor protein 1 n=1 Tax=Vermiconidia calcicola TaxID=1690605 RepID=A0ACC3MG25_9PEZI|nr:Prenylated Rab acceptor protein 1 [Vermiconidia calcicola]